MAEWCNRCKVQIGSYCLMPNHTHLIAVPESEEGLERVTGEAHRRYTRYINFQKGWKGHLWQGEYAFFPMDEQYLIATARYIELNPMKAGIVKRPEKYRWSSTKAHLEGKDEPLLEIIADSPGLLTNDISEEEDNALRRHERSGRPPGSDNFLSSLENLTSRVLRKQKPGPKKSNYVWCPYNRRVPIISRLQQARKLINNLQMHLFCGKLE